MNFYLDIYHTCRSIQNTNNYYDKSCFPAHIYISLGNPNFEEFFGWYPKKSKNGFSENIKIENDQKYLFKKRIYLSVKQYNQALTCAKKLSKAYIDHQNLFNFNNIIDFIQSIYNASKLPLHFTHVYSQEELSKLPVLSDYLLSDTFLKNYGSRTKQLTDPINVIGSSKEEIASRLNVPLEHIKQIIHFDFNNNPAVTLSSSFEIKLQILELFAKALVITINSPIEEEQIEKMFKSEPEFVSKIFKRSIDDNSQDVLNDKLLIYSLSKKSHILKNKEKLEKFLFQVNVLLNNYNSKIERIMKCIINNLCNIHGEKDVKEKNYNLFFDKINAEVVQADINFRYHNNNFITEKRHKIYTEVQQNLEATDINTQIFHTFSNHSMMILESSSDSAEQKQFELNATFEHYQTQYDNEVETFKTRHLMKKLNENLKNSEYVAFLIIQMNESFFKKIRLQVEQVNEKLTTGDYTDTESAVNYIGVQISAHLYYIHKIYHSNCNEIDYKKVLDNVFF